MHILRSNMACYLCALSLVLCVNAKVLNVTENGTITLIVSPTLLSTGKPILARNDGILSSTGTKSKVVALNGTEEMVKDELNELLTGIPDAHFDHLRELTLLNETETEIYPVKRVSNKKNFKEVKAVVFEDLTGKDLKTKELNEHLLGFPLPKNVPTQVLIQTSNLAKITKPSLSDDSSSTSKNPDLTSTDSENSMGTTDIKKTTAAIIDIIKNVTRSLEEEKVTESAPPTSLDDVLGLIKTVVESSTKQFNGSNDSSLKLITKPTEESSKSTLPASISTTTENTSVMESRGKTGATNVENTSIESEKVTATNLASKLSSISSKTDSVGTKPAVNNKITAAPIVSNGELQSTKNTSLKLSSSSPSSSVTTVKEQSSTANSITVINDINEDALKSLESPTRKKPFVTSTIDIDRDNKTDFKQVKNGNLSKNEDTLTIQYAVNDVTNSSNFNKYDEMLEQLTLLETEAMRELEDLEKTLMNLTLDDYLPMTKFNESTTNDESLTNFVEYYLALGKGSNGTQGEILISTTVEYVAPNNVTQFTSDVVLNEEVLDDKTVSVATQVYGENVTQQINSSTTLGSVTNGPTTQLSSSSATDVTEIKTENPTSVSTTKKRGLGRRKRKRRNRIPRGKRNSDVAHVTREKDHLNVTKNNPAVKRSARVLRTDNKATHENITRNTSKSRNNRNDDLKLKKDNITMAFLIDADDLTLNVKVEIENKNLSETDRLVSKPNLHLSGLVLDESNASKVSSNVVPTDARTGKAQRVNLTKKETLEGEKTPRMGDYAEWEKYPWQYSSERRSPFYDLLLSEATRDRPSYSDEDNEVGNEWSEWKVFPEHSEDGGVAPEVMHAEPQRMGLFAERFMPGQAPQAMALKEGAKEVMAEATDRAFEMREKSKDDGDFLFTPNMISDSETQEEIHLLNQMIDDLLIDDELDNYMKMERQQEEEDQQEVSGPADNANDKEDENENEPEPVTENRGPPIDDVIVPSSGYLWTVTLPAFIGMLVVVVFCCICLHTKCFCCKLFEERKTSSPRTSTDNSTRRQQQHQQQQQYPSSARGGHSMA